MSNFYEISFVDDQNREWPTTEHYFQAMKHHTSEEYVEVIRNAPTPGECFRLGRGSSKTFRKDWESVKDDVMLTALRFKFD